MSERLTWFLVGVVTASAFWAVLLAVLDRQLLDMFFGFTGH